MHSWNLVLVFTNLGSAIELQIPGSCTQDRSATFGPSDHEAVLSANQAVRASLVIYFGL